MVIGLSLINYTIVFSTKIYLQVLNKNMNNNNQNILYKVDFSYNLLVLLYCIVFFMIFEGILRKLFPSVSTIIFFFKDIICLIGLYLIYKEQSDYRIFSFNSVLKYYTFLMLPIFFFTGIIDPILAVFGFKQYVLYVSLVPIFYYAFAKQDEDVFLKFIFIFSLFIIPTTLIAVLQNTLPDTHWLNKNIEGESLIAFSRGGVLRVSSTFSFTGQYSFYLNAAGAFLGLSLFVNEYKQINKVLVVTFKLILVLLLVIGVFITGGRTSVFGTVSATFVGVILIFFRQPKLVFRKFIIAGVVVYLLIGFVKTQYPQFFYVYEARQESNASSNELENRIVNSFLNVEWLADLNIKKLFFGQGIGVMSNGSMKLSDYAVEIRKGGFWTENDFQSTLWEGGLYLVLVFYGLRLFVIIYCFNIWLNIKHLNFISGGAFLLGFIIIQGFISPLGIQNTIAIWWWIVVSALITLSVIDKKKSIV